MDAVKAIEVLEQRYYNGPMTPDLAYDLILKSTGDHEAALRMKVQLTLSSMPKP